MNEKRISTGIKGLDEILNGGFIPASSYLIVGSPGTGKTILSLQFLKESRNKDSKSLIITFAEPEESIRRNAASFGWDLSGIHIIDFSKTATQGQPEGEYTVFAPSEVESQPIWKRIYTAIDEINPDRLVIDSATYLQYLSVDKYQYHKQIQALVNKLYSKKCISLFLYDPIELEKDNALALAVDGIITLRNDISENRIVEVRTIEVSKLRGSSFMSGLHPFRITGKGITVWPHRIEKLKKYTFKRELLPSGISGLDNLLMGGVNSGTCTLVTGPAGVGKSTLVLQFMLAAARRGEKCVHYTFEEGLASMLERCSALSMPLDKYVEEGTIVVRQINSLEFYPDEFLEMLRQDMETQNASVFSIDSLRGYNLAMDQFGSVVAHMQNIVNYIRINRLSLFLVNEQELLTGDLRITDLGVSYIADNVLLIRFAEMNGEIKKVISCLKKRLGNYQPELREFSFNEHGLEVGEKLTRLRGVLTGIPSWESNNKE